jgi:hypothetical protein
MNNADSHIALTEQPKDLGRGCNGCIVVLAILVLVVFGTGLIAFNAIAKIGARERQKMESPEAVRSREMAAEARSGFYTIRDSVRAYYKSTSKIPKDLTEVGLGARLSGKHFGPSSYRITTTDGKVVHAICVVTASETFTFTFDVTDNSEGELGLSSFR